MPRTDILDLKQTATGYLTRAISLALRQNQLQVEVDPTALEETSMWPCPDEHRALYRHIAGSRGRRDQSYTVAQKDAPDRRLHTAHKDHVLRTAPGGGLIGSCALPGACRTRRVAASGEGRPGTGRLPIRMKSYQDVERSSHGCPRCCCRTEWPTVHNSDHQRWLDRPEAHFWDSTHGTRTGSLDLLVLQQSSLVSWSQMGSMNGYGLHRSGHILFAWCNCCQRHSPGLPSHFFRRRRRRPVPFFSCLLVHSCLAQICSQGELFDDFACLCLHTFHRVL